MGKGFKIALFITIGVFVYAAGWQTYALPSMKNARWGILAMMFLFAASAPRISGREPRGGAVRNFSLAFAMIAVLSAAWSTMRPFYTFMRGVSVVLLVSFLYFALWPRLKKTADYVSLLNVLVACAWIASLVSMVFWLRNYGETVRYPTGAVQGIFGNPNMAGMVYAVLVPLTVARFHIKKRIWNAGLIFMIALLLYACQSRAGWAGAMLGTGAFYATYYGKRLWIAVVAVFVLAAVFVFVRDLNTARLDSAGMESSFEQALMRGETDTSEYGSGRIPLWMGAYAKWQKRPFLGYGFGTAGDTYYRGTSTPARFHSSFVQITAELGLVGLTFFILPMVFSAYMMIKAPVASIRDVRTRAVIAGFTGAWLGGAGDSFFESWLFSVGNVACLLAWICFAAAMKGLYEPELLTGETVNEKAPEE